MRGTTRVTAKDNSTKAAGEESSSLSKLRGWLQDYTAGQSLGEGAKIPSERVLATSTGLSRPTIARALSRLVEEGVLTRGPGRTGTFLNGSVSARLTARTRTIGMVMPRMEDLSPGESDLDGGLSHYSDQFRKENISAEIMHGVLSVVQEAGCRLVVYHSHSWNEETQIIEHLADEHLDGAIVMPEFRFVNRQSDTPPISGGLPIVFVDRHPLQGQADWVVTDNYAAAKDAVASLIAKGHRRIAFFTDFTDLSSVDDREAGYRAALTEAGIAVDESLVCGPSILRGNEWSFEHALSYCTKLADPATALFAINDDAVWAALQAAKALGLSVPGDLEVAGFFDTRIMMSTPGAFLRVVQRKSEIGQIAARLLLDRISGTAPPEPQHIFVPADLVAGSLE